jgi:hypothetical protein
MCKSTYHKKCLLDNFCKQIYQNKYLAVNTGAYIVKCSQCEKFDDAEPISLNQLRQVYLDLGKEELEKIEKRNDIPRSTENLSNPS